jgi:hypothetical protein
VTEENPIAIGGPQGDTVNAAPEFRGAGPDGVCWEHQAGELPIRLSFTIKVF